MQQKTCPWCNEPLPSNYPPGESEKIFPEPCSEECKAEMERPIFSRRPMPGYIRVPALALGWKPRGGMN